VHLATSQDKLLILTLHQLALARSFSHRIIGLKDGSLAFDLASQDFDSKAIEELYTRPTTNKFFPGAQDRLSQPGVPETNPVPSPPQIHRWPNWSPIQLGLGLLALGGVSYAIQATEVSPSAFVRGVPQVFDFLARLFPPEFEMEAQEWSWAGDRTVHLPRALRITWETILMAVVGTLGGIFLASPISILAARNTSPHPIIYWCSRFILNANRAIPDIIYALVMVAAVGLGPFAGVLALTLASMGSIAKVFAEVIESVAQRPVESLRVTGASWWMVFRYAILPQSLPVMASYGLLYFEHNLRSATILGLVGAGGGWISDQRILPDVSVLETLQRHPAYHSGCHHRRPGE
ncbi:MAG: phosphonate ABC transporter, permease protein PhnE, partial [Verrucomicrobia bacterium]|nr:phosphonate ABC transporter, permease protein PhnE [Verrucomicrobiota bacterium]